MKEFLELVARTKKSLQCQDFVGANAHITELRIILLKERHDSSLVGTLLSLRQDVEAGEYYVATKYLDNLIYYVQDHPEILNPAVQPQTFPPRPQPDNEVSEIEVDPGDNEYKPVPKPLLLIFIFWLALTAFIIIVGFGMYFDSQNSRQSDAVSNGAIQVSLTQDGKIVELPEKIYSEVKDIPVPKGEFYAGKFYDFGRNGKEYGRILIVPTSPNETIFCGEFAKDSEIAGSSGYCDLGTNRCRGMGQYGIYSVYDRVVGSVPRGKVLKRHGLDWPKYIDPRVIDVELESGEKTRILVRPNLLAELGVGDDLVPKNVVPLSRLSDEAMFKEKGWLNRLENARGDLYEFVPLNGKEKPFICLAQNAPKFSAFYGDGDEPKIKSNFGYCPEGVVK